MNLDSRTDRWNQVVKDFKRLQAVMPIQIERVSAVEMPQRPQAGASCTFKKIITMAKEQKLPYVLIMEDDLFVIDPQKVLACLNDAPENWDILLGGVYHYSAEKAHDGNWMKLKDFCSLHFIIIRCRIYDKILGFKSSGQHMDRQLGAQTKSGALKSYVMHPMPCQQRPGYSNIRKRKVNDNRRKLPWVNHPDTLKN